MLVILAVRVAAETAVIGDAPVPRARAVPRAAHSRAGQVPARARPSRMEEPGQTVTEPPRSTPPQPASLPLSSHSDTASAQFPPYPPPSPADRPALSSRPALDRPAAVFLVEQNPLKQACSNVALRSYLAVT